MKELIRIFNYVVKNEVRTLEINGEIWFVLKDVCDALGLSNPTKVGQRLEYDEQKKVDPNFFLGSRSNEPIIIINESGLYSVILGSNKKEAKIFKRWITNEVLPSIEKQANTPLIIKKIKKTRYIYYRQNKNKQKIQKIRKEIT